MLRKSSKSGPYRSRSAAVGFVTPEQRHAGLDAALLRERTVVYEAAKALHPNRWSGDVRNWELVEIVHLNPEKGNTLNSETEAEPLTLKQAA